MSTENISENEKKLDRLLSMFAEIGVNQAKFIEITGYSSGQASAIWNKKANLNRRLLKAICTFFSFSENYIETGRGERIAEGKAAYGVTEVHRKLRPDQEKILKAAEEHDELVRAVLDLEETPELLLILQDMKGMTKEERWEYAKAGRKAVRGGKPSVGRE